MKKAIKLILFILVSILVILKIISLFIEVPKEKKILDIQQSISSIKFKMPHGTHFNPYLVVDKDSTVEGNITIRHDGEIIYAGKIHKKILLKSKNKIAYTLIPIERISNFFKQNKEYDFTIQIENVDKSIWLELSWLNCSLCGYL